MDMEYPGNQALIFVIFISIVVFGIGYGCINYSDGAPVLYPLALGQWKFSLIAIDFIAMVGLIGLGFPFALAGNDISDDWGDSGPV